jgi:hypothetical protein
VDYLVLFTKVTEPFQLTNLRPCTPCRCWSLHHCEENHINIITSEDPEVRFTISDYFLQKLRLSLCTGLHPFKINGFCNRQSGSYKRVPRTISNLTSNAT